MEDQKDMYSEVDEGQELDVAEDMDMDLDVVEVMEEELLAELEEEVKVEVNGQSRRMGKWKRTWTVRSIGS